MGNVQNDSEGDSDEKPVHIVRLTYDYWMGKYEVTFDEFTTYCKATLARMPDDSGWGRGKRPVINLNWKEATAYCNWLSEKEGLKVAYDANGNLLDKTGNSTKDITKVEGYRLPTEAEWEYAARGGQNTKGYKYSGSDTLSEVGWYKDNAGSKTHEVGKKKANELGIFDMSGNVWEWCYDWYASYTSKTQTNPIGANSGPYRLIRGGGWYYSAHYCRVVIWGSYYPSFMSSNLGFRIVRTDLH